MTSSKKPVDPCQIPMAHVMAFNAVSANAYVGHAIAECVSCDLDGDPDFDVIVLAESVDNLKRFFALTGMKADFTKSAPVALAHQRDLRIMRSDNMQSRQVPPSDDDL
jgi:hypothetical protein